jgi:hypothetical protein
MPWSIRRCSGSALLASAVSSIALCACGSQTRQTTPSSPARLLHAALSNATARGSVHEVGSSEKSGQTVAFSDDVAAHGGRQTITLPSGQRALVLVVGDVAYISGDQAVLTHYFGLSPSAAKAVGTRWLSIPSSSRAYVVVANDATLPTALDGLSLTGRLTELAPSTISGEPVVGIKGDVSLPGAPPNSVAATIYISRSGKPLPVGATYSFSSGVSGGTMLSQWGEHLSLQAPAHVIAPHALNPVGHPSSAATAVPRTHTSDPGAAWIGYWQATGRVLQARDSAIQAPGEIIHRAWRIYQACASHTCSLEFERQTAGPTAETLGTPLTAQLVGTNNGWRTGFSEPNVYCMGSTADHPGVEDSHWHITRATSDTISAVETTSTSGPACKTGTTKITWTARRLSLEPSAPA